MKGKAKLITNSKQLEQAQKMGTACEPVWGGFDIYFDSRIIAVAFINVEGNINVWMAGRMWTLHFDEELWKHIKELLESR